MPNHIGSWNGWPESGRDDLGRPGHARKCQAICRWLNKSAGNGNNIAWAKQEPARIDIQMPEVVRNRLQEYGDAINTYGKQIYAAILPTGSRSEVRDAITSLVDLTFNERGCQPLSLFKDDAERLRSRWLEHLLPDTELDAVHKILTSAGTSSSKVRPEQVKPAWLSCLNQTCMMRAGPFQFSFIRILRMKTLSGGGPRIS